MPLYFSVNVSDTSGNSSNSAASQGSKKWLAKLISWINYLITQACFNMQINMCFTLSVSPTI